MYFTEKLPIDNNCIPSCDELVYQSLIQKNLVSFCFSPQERCLDQSNAPFCANQSNLQCVVAT